MPDLFRMCAETVLLSETALVTPTPSAGVLPTSSGHIAIRSVEPCLQLR